MSLFAAIAGGIGRAQTRKAEKAFRLTLAQQAFERQKQLQQDRIAAQEEAARKSRLFSEQQTRESQQFTIDQFNRNLMAQTGTDTPEEARAASADFRHKQINQLTLNSDSKTRELEQAAIAAYINGTGPIPEDLTPEQAVSVKKLRTDFQHEQEIVQKTRELQFNNAELDNQLKQAQVNRLKAGTKEDRAFITVLGALGDPNISQQDRTSVANKMLEKVLDGSVDSALFSPEVVSQLIQMSGTGDTSTKGMSTEFDKLIAVVEQQALRDFGFSSREDIFEDEDKKNFIQDITVRLSPFRQSFVDRFGEERTAAMFDSVGSGGFDQLELHMNSGAQAIANEEALKDSSTQQYINHVVRTVTNPQDLGVTLQALQSEIVQPGSENLGPEMANVDLVKAFQALQIYNARLVDIANQPPLPNSPPVTGSFPGAFSQQAPQTNQNIPLEKMIQFLNGNSQQPPGTPTQQSPPNQNVFLEQLLQLLKGIQGIQQ